MNEMRRSAELVRPAKVFIQPTPHPLVRFELIDNLYFNSYTQARELVWSNSQWKADDTTEATVYDVFGMFCQWCKPKNQDGARGWARQFPEDAERWEIINMQWQAKWIEFVVNDYSGFTTSSPSVTVDGVIYHNGYEPDTAITTVYNGSSVAGCRIFEGDDNDVGEALYDPLTGKYIISQLECP